MKIQEVADLIGMTTTEARVVLKAFGIVGANETPSGTFGKPAKVYPAASVASMHDALANFRK